MSMILNKISLPVLAIGLLFALAGFLFLQNQNLRGDLQNTRQELALERVVVATQQEAIADLEDYYDTLNRRLRHLDAERARADRQVLDMKRAIDGLNLTQETERDPDSAADRLLDSGNQLNRMLEQASDFGQGR